jgi:hypothetical protein
MSALPSSIDAAKGRMNYQAALRRPMCGNCQHLIGNNTYLSCGKGGFFTTRYAICAEHVREQGAKA